MYYFRVWVPIHTQKTFTYHHCSDVQPGSYVLIPFKNTQLVGIVFSANNKTNIPLSTIKSIIKVLDIPILHKTFMDFIAWVARYNFSTIGTIIKSILINDETALYKWNYQYTKQSKDIQSVAKTWVVFQSNETLLGSEIMQQANIKKKHSRSFSQKE